MLEGIRDLSRARILVTNDDGIHAPGLKALEKIARSLSNDVWVVAPESEQSAVAHSLTLRRPLYLRKLGSRRFSVDGTPTDCVLVAVKSVLKEGPPDLVLSGVNHGGNLGEDVTYSGTVAAAMEASILGLRAIALSLCSPREGRFKWATAEAWAGDIVRNLAAAPWRRDLLYNINFPDRTAEEVVGVKACSQGRRQIGTSLTEGRSPGGRPYLWIGNFAAESGLSADSDLGAIEAGFVSVSPLHLDLTHRPSLKPLRGTLGESQAKPAPAKRAPAKRRPAARRKT